MNNDTLNKEAAALKSYLASAKEGVGKVFRSSHPPQTSLDPALPIDSRRTFDVAEREQVRKNLIAGDGTGAISGAPLWVAEKFGEKPKQAVSNALNKAVEYDRKGGEYLASKGKALNSIFSKDVAVPTGELTQGGNKITEYAISKEKRLTAPLDTVKTIAVPLLAFEGANSIAKGFKNKEDVKMAEESIRELIIEKLAEHMIGMETQTARIVKTAELQSKMYKAASLLKESAEKISNLEQQIESLQEKLAFTERKEKAIKLAKDMVAKGVIKRSDIDNKVEHLATLNDKEFAITKETIDQIPLKLAKDSGNGLDKVSYMLVGDNDSPEDKPTLGDVIKMKAANR